MLDKLGYYITFSDNILIFYGDRMETYSTLGWEITYLDSKKVQMLNNVLEFDFIGEL